MRIDEQLLEGQQDPDAVPTLRFFRWRQPTLSYGRLQDLRQALALAETDKRILEVVRRPTGGGMVRHDDDLSLSLVWRRDHASFPKCLKDIYRKIHKIAQAALEEKGIETTFHQNTKTGGGRSGLCFAEPAEDDLMFAGDKILGGALRVTSRARLYQGNLRTDLIGIQWEYLAADMEKSFEKTFFKQPARTGPSAGNGALPANRGQKIAQTSFKE